MGRRQTDRDGQTDKSQHCLMPPIPIVSCLEASKYRAISAVGLCPGPAEGGLRVLSQIPGWWEGG